MSWDADLYVDSLTIRSWNYTHNTNPMIQKVIDIAGVESGPPSWWDRLAGDRSTAWWYALDGCSGDDGATLLDLIVSGLMEAPDLFRGMNPSNGWGDYDSLVDVLAEMRDAGRAHPTATWEASG